ncbi:YhjD/YihY/BrkB family envelope integrity protein [Halostreptopolyspora alba]|uniref:YhjD/YihY/BrkB family envelope integrity protein n=1 Tax=Halostreptopolyspora alba TaxID=2487137 RepID=UPI003715520A
MSERSRSFFRELSERHRTMGAVVLLVARMVPSAMRIRVVGLAAEAAFFSLLSLPALLLGLLGALGHLSPVVGVVTVEETRAWIIDTASLALTTDTVDSLVVPLIDDFLRGAQGSVLSITFLVSLWSGSRAMNVFIDAITIGYGLNGLRGFVWQRVLALIAYIGGLLFALVVLPILVAGPTLVHNLVPYTGGHLHLVYWPAVGGISTLAVVLLYTLSVPVHMPPWRHLPGALLATLILVVGSVLLRLYLSASFGQVSIYGSLAAPIAILVWFWVIGMAVLLGSALNAEIDSMWPTERTATARAELAALNLAHTSRLAERSERALRDVSGEEGNTAAEDTDETEPPAEGPTQPRPVAGVGQVGRQSADTSDRGADTPGPVPRQAGDADTPRRGTGSEDAHAAAPEPVSNADERGNVDNERTEGPHTVTSGRSGARERPEREDEQPE